MVLLTCLVLLACLILLTCLLLLTCLVRPPWSLQALAWAHFRISRAISGIRCVDTLPDLPWARVY